MNIYLVNNAPTNIVSLLQHKNVNIWSRTTGLPSVITGFSWNALERVDAIILEISYPSDELHYILAQAIVLQRPTLCLYPKNREPREMLLHLQKPSVPKSVVARSYTTTTISEVIGKFLHSIDHTVQLDQTPNIKFTLRLTPAISHYLTWLTEFKNVNKADYLRQLLKDTAEKDNDYQKLM
ncbi:MAG: hypothetical protein WCV88_01195 [Patescibacteria group bacterium]|jgi:hypothetical protein